MSNNAMRGIDYHVDCRWQDIIEVVKDSEHDDAGNENRWRLGRASAEEIQWIVGIIRERVNRNHGDVPKEIEALRSGPKGRPIGVDS